MIIRETMKYYTQYFPRGFRLCSREGEAVPYLWVDRYAPHHSYPLKVFDFSVLSSLTCLLRFKVWGSIMDSTAWGLRCGVVGVCVCCSAWSPSTM